MARLIWTESALLDLEELAEYIALENPTAARGLVQNLFNKAERLEQHPRLGRRPPELKDTPYREVIAGPCRVFYRIDGEAIFILHVMGGEQQLKKYLLDARRKDIES